MNSKRRISRLPYAAASLAALLIALPAFAATAFFTGRQEMVQTVTYKMAWRCQYNYAGKTFWMLFEGYCPGSVEVQ